MCEYAKLATCRLGSVSSELARADTVGRAGFVSKRTTQATIRTFGASVLSIKTWMVISLTYRRKIEPLSSPLLASEQCFQNSAYVLCSGWRTEP